jgi:5-methylcytosine-specific restriction protein A
MAELFRRHCGRCRKTHIGRCPASVQAFEAKRGTSSQRGYDARWRKLRAAFIAENPLCVFCQRDGRVTPAAVVDHIVAHKGNEILLLDWNNLQSLCKHHHDSTKQKLERRNA